ncbi:MAG: putative alpha/beta-fold hydrolase [Cyclobacteriaceae bacterium]
MFFNRTTKLVLFQSLFKLNITVNIFLNLAFLNKKSSPLGKITKAENNLIYGFMSIIENSSYKKPSILLNRHLETIVPGLLRKIQTRIPYERERITTSDDDFLDLDWIKKNNERLIIISHGLEGDSSRPYVIGMANAFSDNGWDALAWNFRGCSGEMNRTNRFYHSGATDDLEAVIGHAVSKGYREICLTGFSLGGNMTLKYLGESTTQKFEEVKKAVVFSVPLDLAGCSREIHLPHNILYSRRFLKSLKKKVNQKSRSLPDFPSVDGLEHIKSLYEFDDVLTGPLHGFDSADHYYASCSSINFLTSIKIRTLVVNALNDPFLSKSCLGRSAFENLDQVTFEVPKYGGHVGFSEYNRENLFWSEKRALKFINEDMNNYD